jgi:uncharacterized protein YjbI with pentapeptide repeats
MARTGEPAGLCFSGAGFSGAGFSGAGFSGAGFSANRLFSTVCKSNGSRVLPF